MTDIEQQIAQASLSKKSTAILADPEQVIEPLQILPFVSLFFNSYKQDTIESYKEKYNLPIYHFARMLIGFSDPPNLGAVMNNGDYFMYWIQFENKIQAWFGAMQSMIQDNAQKKSYWQQLLDYFKTADVNPEKTPNTEAAAMAFVIVGVFEKLDEQYHAFQRLLIEQQSKAIQSLGDEEIANHKEWVTRMDTFLKKRSTAGSGGWVFSKNGSWIPQYVKDFIDHVLVPIAAPFPNPMPIGAERSPLASTTRKIVVLNGGSASNVNPRLGESTASRRSAPAAVSPEMEKASVDRMAKETSEMTSNSIIEHYRQIIGDFGNLMLQLFRSFHFPPVFTLDQTPSFTAEWDGYIDLAYRSFYDLARQRHAYLQSHGSPVTASFPKWSKAQLYEDDDASALFAEFVGYKKAIPQNTIAPAPNVQRTNATYHYARTNMSLRFIALYDYMMEKEMLKPSSKRRKTTASTIQPLLATPPP